MARTHQTARKCALGQPAPRVQLAPKMLATMAPHRQLATLTPAQFGGPQSGQFGIPKPIQSDQNQQQSDRVNKRMEEMTKARMLRKLKNDTVSEFKAKRTDNRVGVYRMTPGVIELQNLLSQIDCDAILKLADNHGWQLSNSQDFSLCPIGSSTKSLAVSLSQRICKFIGISSLNSLIDLSILHIPDNAEFAITPEKNQPAMLLFLSDNMRISLPTRRLHISSKPGCALIWEANRETIAAVHHCMPEESVTNATLENGVVENASLGECGRSSRSDETSLESTNPIHSSDGAGVGSGVQVPDIVTTQHSSPSLSSPSPCSPSPSASVSSVRHRGQYCIAVYLKYERYATEACAASSTAPCSTAAASLAGSEL